jgi:hypothetical protein
MIKKPELIKRREVNNVYALICPKRANYAYTHVPFHQKEKKQREKRTHRFFLDLIWKI